MEMITIQSKRDINRIEIVSQETWGQMVELKLHRNWKVIQSPEPITTVEVKTVEQTIEEFIKAKQPKKTTKTK